MLPDRLHLARHRMPTIIIRRHHTPAPTHLFLEVLQVDTKGMDRAEREVDMEVPVLDVEVMEVEDVVNESRRVTR